MSPSAGRLMPDPIETLAPALYEAVRLPTMRSWGEMPEASQALYRAMAAAGVAALRGAGMPPDVPCRACGCRLMASEGEAAGCGQAATGGLSAGPAEAVGTVLAQEDA